MAISAEQAFAPLDYSGAYGKVAETMVGAGQVVNKAMDDWAKFEKEKDKERLRLQAISEVGQKYPELLQSKAVGQNTSLEDLGKGLYQMGASEYLFERIKKAGGTAPDPNEMARVRATAFRMSEKSFKDWQDNMAKQADEMEKRASQSAAFNEASGQVARAQTGEEKPLSREQILRAAGQSKTAGNLSAENIRLLEGQGVSEVDAEKLRLKEKQIEEAARTARARLGSDNSFRNLVATAGILDKNIDNQTAAANFIAKADEIERRADQLAATHGVDKKAAYADAKSLRDLAGYMKVNLDFYQGFAADVLGKAAKELGVGGGRPNASPSEVDIKAEYEKKAKEFGWKTPWEKMTEQMKKDFSDALKK